MEEHPLKLCELARRFFLIRKSQNSKKLQIEFQGRSIVLIQKSSASIQLPYRCHVFCLRTLKVPNLLSFKRFLRFQTLSTFSNAFYVFAFNTFFETFRWPKIGNYGAHDSFRRTRSSAAIKVSPWLMYHRTMSIDYNVSDFLSVSVSFV